MYIYDSRVRYSETNSEGKMTLNAMLNYFQDVTTFHSEDIGLGLEYMKNVKMAWVLNFWQIVPERFPEMGEKITVGTLPYEFKSFMGQRNFFMKDEQGNYLAKANTIWSLINLETGRPTPALPEMIEGYKIEERLPMDYAGRKIAIPEGGHRAEPVVVAKHHLDTNYHVNNGQYVSMAMEFLPEGAVIRQMRAEYKKQAFLGDILHPYVVCGDHVYTVSMQDEEGKPFAVVEFKIC